jgi:hypothetical protein
MEHIFKGKEKQWAKIISLSWLDENFKRRLFQDPKAILKEHGIELPGEIKINLIEGKPGEVNITLPPKPDNTEGTAEELEKKLSAPPPFWPYFRA